jgi:pimeloyl-ACP methyl ester carboxylesterase
LRRTGRVALIVLGVLVLVLVLNALALSHQTKDAEVNIDGGRIVETSIGGLQVLDEGDPTGPPIVLIHCYTCSLHWWDRLAPGLTGAHRVIRIDLLGHGGSDKPRAGYGIEDQARGVAEALAELGVSEAIVVGHALGGTVAVALATQSPDLVSGIVEIAQAPDTSYGGLGFAAKLGWVPVIGQAMDRLGHIVPASMLADQYGDVFAPGFDLAQGFDNPDQPVVDLRAMTYTSYNDAASAEEDYTDEEALTDRLAALHLPVLGMFGAEDQIYDAQRSLHAFKSVPGARTVLIQGAGHSPNVEKPDEVARLILGFAAAHGPPPTEAKGR